MNRLVWAVLTAALLSAPAVAACARSSDGTALRETDAASAASSTITATSSKPATTTDAPESAEPGVVETTRQPVPPNAVACPPPASAQTAVATVSDPAAPRITVAVPDGWSSATGAGEVGTQLSGPDGMVAEVTISATTLDAAAAFTRYSDDVMAKYPISTLSLLPAELCGFSGQKMMGTWADNPDRSIQYTDRIAHIWTNTNDYLIAIHVQAPSDVPGFDAAASVLIGDFGVGIP